MDVEDATLESPRVLARATVHLQGLPVGATVLVDPDDPYIAGLLDAELLVLEGDGELGNADLGDERGEAEAPDDGS